MRRYRALQRRPFEGPRGWLLALVVLAGMALLTLLLRPVEPPFSGGAYAVDGDTLKIGVERVRLLGIDAPELAQTCTRSSGEEWPCGRSAREALAMAAKGTIACAPHGRDRYGRILAKCESEGIDLAGVVVEAGLAVAEFDYLAAELGARSAGRGIWSGSFDLPRLWRELHGIGADAN